MACAQLYEAEKLILESLAPPSYSPAELKQFVFYHLHGEEMPEGLRRILEDRDVQFESAEGPTHSRGKRKK